MATQRRRRQYYSHVPYLIPAISAISSLLLIFFIFISFAPSPIHNDRFHNSQRYISRKYGVSEANETPVFRIPINGGVYDNDIWSSTNAQFYHGCSNASSRFAKAEDITQPNRFLVIATSGGLNQQRTGITDAVVAARILNATLVVPKLDKRSFWKDDSNFRDIFNVDWFISYLSEDVKIIRELPPKNGEIWNPRHMRVPRKCNEGCYVKRLIPVLSKKHAVQLSKFDYRLSNRLREDLQKLRCRVNYHALKFTNPILEMGGKLVERMRVRSKHYIALHLRFEPDMLAFSGCYYGGGEHEERELGKLRSRWKTLHNRNPDRGRRQGRCPLTPVEVGLMLRALGFGHDTHIYVASGEVYRGEETLAPLKALFPNFYSKETLSMRHELEPFSAFSARMAALDFIVCDESDVFVTNNNGNMAKILAGRRRYFGHKPTIRPNSKKLYKLFLNRNNMTWEEFASNVRTFQKGFMGEPNEMRPGRGVFHEYPTACICEDSKAKATMSQSPPKHGTVSLSETRNENNKVVVDDQNMDNEREVSDPEYEEDTNDQQREDSYDDSSMEEELELDELLSD